MSTGPGKIERAIEAAFRERPSHAFCVDELSTIVFPEIYPPGKYQGPLEKKHRVTIIRAANKVAKRMGYLLRPPFGSGGKHEGMALAFHNPADPYAHMLAMCLMITFTAQRKGDGRNFRWDVLDVVAGCVEQAKKNMTAAVAAP